MLVASKIRTARNLSGMTQLQLADQVFTNEKTIRRIEHGQQKADQHLLDAIAGVTGCPWVANPFVPDDYKPLEKSQAFVALYSAVQNVNNVLPKLAEILEDDKVDAAEKKDYEKCMATVMKAHQRQADMCYAR